MDPARRYRRRNTPRRHSRGTHEGMARSHLDIVGHRDRGGDGPFSAHGIVSMDTEASREGRNVLSATKLTRGFRVHVYDPVARVWAVTATITVPDDIEV